MSLEAQIKASSELICKALKMPGSADRAVALYEQFGEAKNAHDFTLEGLTRALSARTSGLEIAEASQRLTQGILTLMFEGRNAFITFLKNGTLSEAFIDSDTGQPRKLAVFAEHCDGIPIHAHSLDNEKLGIASFCIHGFNGAMPEIFANNRIETN